MKIYELLEGRHPHDQYYRAKPKSQFKPKPRPKKTLWYGEEQFDGWSADIKSRYPKKLLQLPLTCLSHMASGLNVKRVTSVV